MDTNRRDDHTPEDAFDPIELGSVSEETRGSPGEDDEVSGGTQNSRF